MKELDIIVLTEDIPGDTGTIVLNHDKGMGFEV